MTELRKGQRAQIEVEVDDGFIDEDGEVYVWLPTRGEGELGIHIPLDALRPAADRPTYLARREAMVRALLRADDGLGWTDRIARDFVHDADRILRAIDETPVPEWAGGEHE